MTSRRSGLLPPRPVARRRVVADSADRAEPARARRLGRRLAGLAVAALLVLGPVLLAAAAAAQDIRFHRIGTGTTGGTYFPIGGIIASAISSPPGAPPCELGGSCGVPGLIAVAQASTGSVENLRNLMDGSIELALSQSDVALYAFRGTDVFAQEEAFGVLRGIASLYLEQVHVVVAADSPIGTIADLAGHRVVLGEEGSGTLVASRLILKAHGLSDADLEPLFLAPEPAADAIFSGSADAMVFVAGAPILAIEDLARRADIRLIPITGDGVDNLRREQSFFAETEVPDGTYADVPGVDTIGISALLVTTDALDADTVYGITRALWHPSTRLLLTNGHPRGAEIVVERALDGMAVPLHPGAVRYYNEAGLFDATEPM